MKILLTAINAKYIHSNLAVYSLRAYAEAFRTQVTIAEYTINNRADDILEQIYKEKPDVLCFSCYIWNIDYVEKLIREFHKLCPKVPIWLGGPEVSFEAEAFLETHPQVSGIIIGEGEKTFAELCEFYVNRSLALEEIKGIVYREPQTKNVHRNAPQELLSMSEIPFCYDFADDFKNRIIYYESSRGCPFHCSYCLSSVEKQLRFRDIALVKKELAFFIEKEVPQVKFVDRTFNCKHEHAMAVWQFIKERDKGITNFHFEISADLLNEEELKLLASMRPGLVQLEIGVQSTNAATIAEIHRTMKLERLKETVKWIQAGGNIHEHLDLIAGLPYEDYETFAKSFDEIYALKPNQLQLGFLKVLKGSYLYEHADEYELLYHSTPPYEVLKTKWLPFSDVLKIKQVEEMLELYYNSGQFEVTMKLMELLFESPFLMFQEFGAYYETSGYFAMSHSRIRRCEILLEFVRDCFAKYRTGEKTALRQELPFGKEQRKLRDEVLAIETEICAMLQESLTFDLYYRENCKSRPAFALPLSEFKQEIRHYCKKGSLSHLEPFHYRFPGKEERSIQKLPEYQNEVIFVLFDYEKRDPLDHQAAVCIVDKAE